MARSRRLIACLLGTLVLLLGCRSRVVLTQEISVPLLVSATPTMEPEPYPTPTPAPTPVPTPTPTPDPWLYTTHFACSDADILLAARVAYLEAGGKNADAYRAVLSVIYNRCLAPRFGGGVTSIEEEVYRKGQFSVIHHKGFDSIVPPDDVVCCARDVFLTGSTSIPDNVLFFCASRLGENWGGRTMYKNIGGNLFFFGRTGN